MAEADGGISTKRRSDRMDITLGTLYRLTYLMGVYF
jgi:hypothetical protein